MSFPVPWLPPDASYNLVGSEMFTICEFWLSTATCKWLPVKWRHFCVSSNHLTSYDIICCHVTVSSCELQPFRNWNVQYTGVFGLLQPLPGDFPSNDVTSGHLRSRDVIFCHVTAFSWSYWFVLSEMYSIQVFGLLQPLPGYLWSNDVTSGSLPVTWGLVMSFPVTWLPSPASYRLVGNEMYSIHDFLVFFSHFQDTSGQMTLLPGNFRSPEITWHHFLSCDCLLLRAIAL